LIYFQDGAELANDHRNSVYYFNDGDPDVQSNWSIGCSDNELTLDANLCGSNMQTPGSPNNPANAAFIAQFNNGCSPIPPIAGIALVDVHEQCGCDGQASASGSGSIGPYTYEWFDASMTPIGQTGSTATSLCPGTYFVTITSSIDCDITQSITINPGTGTPSFTLSSVDPSACGIADGTITISGLSSSTNYTVSYSDDGAPIPAVPYTSSGTGTIAIYGLNGGTYANFAVTITSSGCTGTNATTIILTDPPAPVVNDLADQTVCDTYSLPVISGTNLSGTYGYYTAANGGGTSLAAGSAVTTTQTIYIYAINGTCSDEETVLITVNNTPSIDPIADASACGSLILPTITGTNLSGNEAFYNNSQALGGTVITGPINSSQTVWVYDNEGTCSDETSFVVTINPFPDAGIGGGGVFCNPMSPFSPVTIGIANIGTGPFTLIYTENGVNQTIGSSTGQTFYLGASDGITTYTLVSISDQFCTSLLNGSVTVEVINNWSIPVVVDGDSTYCLGDQTALMSVQPYGTTNWYLASGDPVGTGPSIMPLQIPGTTTYMVRQFINDCGGIPAWITITMEPCEMIVPTAFTPNGDGVHDNWEIINLDNVYPNNVVTVYNRWGNLVYQSEKGNYNGNPWNGTYNGNALPVGSFYYMIDLNEGDLESLNGIVSIILE
jgi:gliding motility-associated-like protein